MLNFSYKKGFTLIETLIAMVVLAIGLLGLAGLQASGLRNNESAYYRGQATQLAYDLADRIRSNAVEAERFAVSKYITVLPQNANVKANCDAVAGACSAADLAEHDLAQWYADLTAVLPGSQGSITQVNPNYTISISWDDDRDGNANNNLSFEMSFQI